MKTYLCVYLGSAFLALVITPVVIWLAQRFKIFAVPGARHMHTRPISRIGGVALFFATMPLSISVLFLSNTIGDAFRNVLPQLSVMLLASTFIFAVGLVDDIRAKGLRARTKLLVQFAAAITVCAAGIRIKSVFVADWLILDFGWSSWPLTLLWIVGITNAVNLSDGLDGLAAGISAVACGVIAILAINGGQVIMAVLMLALMGSLSGFLFYNFNPAKIFMGDCGSMFLGFTIASSSVLCSSKSPAFVGLALPLLALGVPIFDTLFSILRRFIERRSLFAADRGHFHHKLINLGLNQRHVVLTIYIVTTIATGLGMFMMVTNNIGSLVIFLCILLLLLLVFQLVGSVRLKETIEGIKRNYAINNQERGEIRSFEEAQLHFRNACTYDQWWSAICKAAERMDFAWVSLETTEKDGTTQTEVWRMAGAKSDISKLVLVTIPLSSNESARPRGLEIAISVNGSYESAGHRATLFARLIDEYRIVES